MDSHIARLFVVQDGKTVASQNLGLLELNIDAERSIRGLGPWIEHNQHHIFSSGTGVHKRIGIAIAGGLKGHKLGIIGQSGLAMM